MLTGAPGALVKNTKKKDIIL